mmetsp:Transcript_35308/g.105547  ORF Transcript_35308/g.105547 Transcript_35308/m.105547 type:complete len:444 (-) Transcript_35308:181-1512(-)
MHTHQSHHRRARAHSTQHRPQRRRLRFGLRASLHPGAPGRCRWAWGRSRRGAARVGAAVSGRRTGPGAAADRSRVFSVLPIPRECVRDCGTGYALGRAASAAQLHGTAALEAQEQRHVLIARPTLRLSSHVAGGSGRRAARPGGRRSYPQHHKHLLVLRIVNPQPEHRHRPLLWQRRRRHGRGGGSRRWGGPPSEPPLDVLLQHGGRLAEVSPQGMCELPRPTAAVGRLQLKTGAQSRHPASGKHASRESRADARLQPQGPVLAAGLPREKGVLLEGGFVVSPVRRAERPAGVHQSLVTQPPVIWRCAALGRISDASAGRLRWRRLGARVFELVERPERGGALSCDGVSHPRRMRQRREMKRRRVPDLCCSARDESREDGHNPELQLVAVTNGGAAPDGQVGEGGHTPALCLRVDPPLAEQPSQPLLQPRSPHCSTRRLGGAG